MSASIEELESLGAGELTRLAKIMDTDTNPTSQLIGSFKTMASQSSGTVNLDKLMIKQDSQLESKLQKAFGRAFNSTTMHPGSKGLEKLLIDKHSTLEEKPAPISHRAAHDVALFIAMTNGNDLQNLTRAELSHVGH